MKNIKELIKERMKSNKKLFSENELNNINETSTKLYIVGLLDGGNIQLNYYFQ